MVSKIRQGQPFRVYLLFFNYLFIYWTVQGLSCGPQTPSCSTWDPVPRPGI